MANIDWARLFRALLGQPEPPVPPVIQTVSPPASMDELQKMVIELGKGLSDAEQSKLWYNIQAMAFNELGEILVDIYPITPEQLRQAITAKYPGINNMRIPDSEFFTTDLPGMQRILTRDWTNLVPYVSNISDCDKFALRFYLHLCDYYGITTVLPVWGDTSGGYHAFNIAVLKDGEQFIAKLIEPQTDEIFDKNGPMGLYVPDNLVRMYGKIN
jgi:hypothetical protein